MGNINFIEGLALVAAFCGAVRWATKDLITSINNLKEAFNNLKETFEKFEKRYTDDLGEIREDVTGLHVKVAAIETDIHNHKGRLKVLENYHKDRSAENA